jgi:hypothetical protein
MHVAEVDLNYTQYYPLYQRYISLYPQKDVGGSETVNQDEHIDDTTKKPPMWAEVEKSMVNGTLDQLRNGSSATVVRQGKIRNSKPTTMKSKTGSNQAKLTSQVNGAASKSQAGFARPSKVSGRSSKHQKSGPGERHVSNRTTDVKDVDDESDGGFFEE